MQIDYFYSLTPRQFENICSGYNRKNLNKQKADMILNRRLMFSFMRPYLKNQNMTEEKFYPFPWEKETSKVDLEAEIHKVETDQKPFWAEYDKRKKNLA